MGPGPARVEQISALALGPFLLKSAGFCCLEFSLEIEGSTVINYTQFPLRSRAFCGPYVFRCYITHSQAVCFGCIGYGRVGLAAYGLLTVWGLWL